MISLTEFSCHASEGGDLGSWAANRLRGALGKSLRSITCVTRAARCDGCSVRRACAYAYCFETEADSDGKFQTAGQEVPRPYVLRGDRVSDGDRVLRFEVVLIGRAAELLPYFVLAVREWEQPGMGPGRQGAQLLCATARHPFDARTHEVYEAAAGCLSLPSWEVSLDGLVRASEALPQERITVEFVTPTRLRSRGEEVRSHPPFRALVSSLLRRLEGLEGSHDLPHAVESPRELIALADGVQLEAWEGGREQRERYSYRQRQRMEWEGIVGQATYQGDLRPFLPALKLGELVHVGKGAVFGLGRVALREPSAREVHG